MVMLSGSVNVGNVIVGNVIVGVIVGNVIVGVIVDMFIYLPKICEISPGLVGYLCIVGPHSDMRHG